MCRTSTAGVSKMSVGKLRVYELKDGTDRPVWLVWCPMCKTHHPYDSWRWKFNNDFENPTFRESMLIKRPERIQEKDGSKIPAYVCHSFVTNGNMEYLPDCTHELKGKTVPLEREQWSNET